MATSPAAGRTNTDCPPKVVRARLSVPAALLLMLGILSVGPPAEAAAGVPGWVIVPPDKVAAGNDGWFYHVETDTRQWVSASCRENLAGRNIEVVEMEWAELSAISDGTGHDCSDLMAVAADPGGDVEPEPLPTILPAASIVLFGPSASWVVVNGAEAFWTSDTDRDCLIAAGMRQQQMEWGELDALRTDGSPAYTCDQYTPGSDPGTDPDGGNNEGTEPIPADGVILLTPDKRPGQDGWFRLADGSIGYIDSTCRTSLEEAGTESEIVEWSTIQAGPDAGALSCDDLTDAPVITYGDSERVWVKASDGGFVTLGKAELAVPSGVMKSDGEISITEMTVDGVHTHDFEIHVPWEGDVLVTAPADLDPAPEVGAAVEVQGIYVAHYDEKRGIWYEEQADWVDFENQTVTATVDTLSPLGALAAIAKLAARGVVQGVRYVAPRAGRGARQFVKWNTPQNEQDITLYAISQTDPYLELVCPHPDDSTAGGPTKWVVRHVTTFGGDSLPRTINGWRPPGQSFWSTGCEDFQHPTNPDPVVRNPVDPNQPPIALGPLTQEACSLQRAFPAYFCDSLPERSSDEGGSNTGGPNGGGSNGGSGGSGSNGGNPPPSNGGPSLNLSRGGVFIGGTCYSNSGCRYINGSGSGWPAGEQFWVQCGDFVNTYYNDPVPYRARYISGSGTITDFNDHICGNNFATTVRVWTASGVQATASIGGV